MHQTNFGFNPQRNTLVTGVQPKPPIDANNFILDSSAVQQRQSLNTQKRNRTHTIDAVASPLPG